MRNQKVPVVLFAYNRVKQLKSTLTQLQKNKVPEIIAFIDGARAPEDTGPINEVEKILKSIKWTKVKVSKRKKNLGLSESIQAGLNEVFMKYDAAVIIEDDVVVADGFYDYMVMALDTYRGRKDVAGVTGLRHPFRSRQLNNIQEDVFLVPRFSSWGWGTWRNVWREIDFHKGSIGDKVARHKPDLDRGGKDISYAYHEYSSGRLHGCWDVVFAVNMALKNQFFVAPKKNLVTNAGLTEGVHADGASEWALAWEGTGKDIKRMPEDLQVDARVVQDMTRYFNRSTKLPLLPRIKRSLKSGVKSMIGDRGSALKAKIDPKLYTTTDGPEEVLSQKECYYFALNNYIKDGDRVLDVGMGIGYGAGVLSIKASEVYAVDVDEKAVAYNKQRLLGKNPRVKDLILYDGITLPFKDRFFDVVTCIDVIEHVEDYEYFLSELIRVAKRHVIVATPNRRPEYTNPDGTPKNHWHLREWSFEEFDAIARRAKGAKVEWHFLNGPWEGPHVITLQERPDTLALLPVFKKGPSA